MVSGGERTPLTLTTCGDDVRMSSSFEGKSIDIAIVSEKIYLINNDAKTYMILNSLVASTMGLDIDDLLNNKNMQFNLKPADTARREKTTLNGQEAELFVIGAGSGEMNVYIVNGEIRRFEKHNDDGEAVYELNSFSDNVSAADVAPNEDYDKQNMLSFFGSLM